MLSCAAVWKAKKCFPDWLELIANKTTIPWSHALGWGCGSEPSCVEKQGLRLFFIKQAWIWAQVTWLWSWWLWGGGCSLMWQVACWSQKQHTLKAHFCGKGLGAVSRIQPRLHCKPFNELSITLLNKFILLKLVWGDCLKIGILIKLSGLVVWPGWVSW